MWLYVHHQKPSTASLGGLPYSSSADTSKCAGSVSDSSSRDSEWLLALLQGNITVLHFSHTESWRGTFFRRNRSPSLLRRGYICVCSRAFDQPCERCSAYSTRTSRIFESASNYSRVYLLTFRLAVHPIHTCALRFRKCIRTCLSLCAFVSSHHPRSIRHSVS
jgi:hypothetical protein